MCGVLRRGARLERVDELFRDKAVKTLRERFDRHTKPGNGTCIHWTGFLDRSGYGEIKVTIGNKRLKRRAHRVSWELSRGQIPDGLCVCHTCDNPRCVNIDHLFLGTQDDNIKDCAKKGRMTMHNAKISELDIPRMKDILACGFSQLKTGEWLGVSQSQVSQAVNGKSWRHK